MILQKRHILPLVTISLIVISGVLIFSPYIFDGKPFIVDTESNYKVEVIEDSNKISDTKLSEMQYFYEQEIVQLKEKYEQQIKSLQKNTIDIETTNEDELLIGELDLKISNLESKIRDYEKEISKLSANSDMPIPVDTKELNDTIKRLKTKVVNLTEQLKDEKTKNLNTGADTRVSSLKSDLKETQKERDVLEKNNTELEVKIKNLEKEIKKLEKIIDKLSE